MSEARHPRRFVQDGQRLDDFDRIRPYFNKLLERDVSTTEKIAQWLIDVSELAACVSEVGTDRYVKMTCHTDDTKLRDMYLDYVENIEPKCRPLWHRLNVKYTQAPQAESLPKDRYFILDRSTRAAVKLFRDENVPLLTEQAKLAQQYQQVCGDMTCQFEGQERTMQQMAVFGEDTDRSVRQAAWETAAKRRLQDRDRIDEIFDALVGLRVRIASNADLVDYREYAFRSYQRFDYTPEDCLEFHDAIERAVIPAVRAMNARRKQRLGVESLRPWDLAVDENGRDRLKPFETEDELCAACLETFRRVDPELAEQFARMKADGHLDLASRKGKAPGGYQSTYEEKRYPFIFMNAVGLHNDVRTLLHEGGHAFHAYAAQDDPLLDYRSSPMEFAEVASMAMEMLALRHYDVIYSGQDLVRARAEQLEHVIKFFPWMAIIDGFQHWIYTHRNHSRSDREGAWLELHERFGTGVDFSGHEDTLASLWHRQLHLFEVPFYYVEYGIAQLGALQIWQNARKDGAQAVANYRRALALGGSRPLPDLFQTAGARFDFGYDTLAPLIASLQQELESLED